MGLRRAVTALVLLALVASVSACGLRGDDAAPTTSTTSTTSSTTATPTSTTSSTATTVARPAGPAGRIDLTFDTADGPRTAHLHVPADLPAGPVPLLVALHGGTGSGDQFERGSGFSEVADEEGFIVAYPDGIEGPSGGLRTWNGGACCGAAVRQDVDDVAFLRQVVGEVEDRYAIDPDRVYASGHSNGMIMSYRLACEAADVFVAVAGQAGTLGVEPCAPSEPVSLLHVHGLADTRLPIDGGRGDGLAGVDFPSPRAGVASFATADGCDAAPSTEALTALVAQQTWAGCDAGTEVRFVAVEGADHAWMGQTTAAHLPDLHPSMDFDTTLAVWAFLEGHPRRS